MLPQPSLSVHLLNASDLLPKREGRGEGEREGEREGRERER